MAAAVAFLPLISAAALSIPEPGTVFYGQVINRHSGHDEVLTGGTLTWTVTDGSATTTLTSVIELTGGNGLYRMELPHSLAAAGLELATGALPLGTTTAECRHVSIAVDGASAAIRPPGRQAFTVGELQRAATFRLDLEISRPFTDADADGLPDWWEDQYGFDKHVNDAGLDKDGDGVSNLAEYLALTDPGRSNSEPQLRTTELTAIADATSALLVQTVDSDTAAAQLVYHVTAVSAPGLKWRQDGGQETALGTGETFTQADVNAGRLIFTHPADEALTAVRLGLSVSDNTSGHTAATGDVMIRFFRPALPEITAALASLAASGGSLPAPAEEQTRTRMYVLARERRLLAWEFSSQLTASAVSSGQPVFIFGGEGADQITGSPGDDFIAGGGGDDSLAGGEGADRFLITSTDDGNDTISDFNPAQADVVELAGVFTGTSTDLRNYVRLTYAAEGATLGLDFDGSGTGYDDMTVSLSGRTAADGDLFTLYHTGRLVVPGLTLPSAVSILATNSSASENGPPAGVFTLTRTGPVEAPLAVSLTMTGPAINGTDYALIESPVIIPAGKSSQEIFLTPFPDSIAEPAEVAQLTLQPGTGYVISGTASAQVAIADLLPEIFIEALERLAVVDSAMPGMILLTRTGLVDRSVLVRLQTAGNATPAADYVRLPSFVNLPPNQTTALLPVTPAAAPVLSNGVETVHVSVTPDAAYRSGNPSRATVHIVPAEHSAAAWMARHAAGNNIPVESFLTQDPGGIGVPNLIRYAFDLSPQSPASATQPRVMLNSGRLAIEFFHDHAARDLRYTVEFSNDFRTWTGGPGVVEDITPLNAADARWSLWRAGRPASADPAQFLRVRVQRQP